ncbi:MAG TPA: CHAT domain-containing protein [Bryobacteraceae bacterium]|nr:CHAT domain-containing protein [Bryobacteraceae bacterium]
MPSSRALGLWFAAVQFGAFSSAQTLTLNDALERTLAFGQTDELQIAAHTNEYLRVSIEGHGMLVHVAVKDPHNRVIAERTRTGGLRDAMTWAAVADAAGSYSVEIVSRETAGAPRAYSITLTDQRQAEDIDRLAAQADSALAEGEEKQQAGEGRKAIDSFERSIHMAQDARDAALEAEACYQLAQAQFSAGNLLEATSRFEQAKASCHNRHDAGNESRALRGLGKLYGDTQQAPKAIDCLERARSLAESTGDLAGEAEALRELGSVAGSRTDFPKAGEFFDRGLALARRAGDRRTEADLLNMLGVLDQAIGKEAETLSNFQAGLTIRRVIGDRAGVAQSTNNLGAYHRNLGEARTAIGYYEESLKMRKQLANPVGIGNALENLAVANGDLGNFEKALDLSLQAAELFRSSQAHRGEMFALTNLGDTCSRMGEQEKALDFYTRALEIARTTGDRRGEALALFGAGSIHASRRHFELASSAFSESLRISREASLQHEMTLALLALADVANQQRDTTAAIASAREALELCRAHEYRREEARARSLLGSALLDTDPKQGNEMLRQALAIQQEIADPDQEALTRSRLAECAERSGDLVAARDQSLKALKLLESVRRNAPPEGPRISFQAYKRPFYQQAVDIFMALDRQQPHAEFDVQAFEVSERFRARALLDQLAESKDLYSHEADPELAGEASRTLELLDNKASRLTRVLSGRHTETQAAAARRALDEMEVRFDGIRSRIRSTCAACSANPQLLSPAELQAQFLDKDSVVLEYMLGAKRSFLWTITKSMFRSYELPARGEIEELVRPAHAALTEPANVISGESPEARQNRIDRSRQEFERAAAALSRVVLPPGFDRNTKKVLIVVDGPLYSIPFSVLLARGTEVSTLPSASSLAYLGRKHESTGIALFADPLYPAGSATLPRLRLAREEALRIGGMTAGRKKLEFGADASRAAASDPSLDNYAILHFAAHALIDDQRPELSGIALSDGLFSLHDIDQLSIHARLVVLSACRTAAGKPAEGEGPISLARAFLYAGAGGVVASLWDVNDRATEVFMTRFYEGLFRRGLSAAAALGFARESMMADSAWSHPYYWAGFVLIGDSAAISMRHG